MKIALIISILITVILGINWYCANMELGFYMDKNRYLENRIKICEKIINEYYEANN